MVDLYTEKAFEAAIDHIYSQMDPECRDDCPAIEAWNEILDNMKGYSNQEIIEQIGRVRVKKCNRKCQR